MKLNPKGWLALPLMLMLAACNLPGAAPAAPVATVDPGLVGTIAAQTLEALYTPTLPPTFTPIPMTATLTATITPTYATPMLRFEGDTNCRQGPGTEFEVVTVIRSGAQTEALGRLENYWLVKNPNSGEDCWVAGDYAKASGSFQALPTVTAPPTPTPKPPTAPAWSSWDYQCEFASGGSNATVSLVWSDRNNNEDGFNIFRNDEIVASMPADSTAYTDVAFVGVGQSVSYTVEVFNDAGQARSSTISVSCQ